MFQENDHYCGPAVVQMVLKSFGIEAAQTEIAKELETDMVVGTSAAELQKFFEKRGFVVERKNNAKWENIAEASKRGAAIIGYIEPEGDPHYALVRSVDEGGIVLRDPTHGDNFILEKSNFLERWRDNEANQYGERMLTVVIQ